MKKIFIDDAILRINDNIDITGDDYFHMSRVLRVRTGDVFIIGDKENNEYSGKITGIDKNKISFILLDKHERIKSGIPDVTILFSILKGDKNEIIIQKCSEIGAAKFIPVVTKNCIVKPDENEGLKKVLKWRKITRETGMQACLKKIPEISAIKHFEELNNWEFNGIKTYCNIQEKNKKILDVMKENPLKKPIAFFIGPEGDFDKNEIGSLKQNGWIGINLSPNILKSETACIFSASAVFSYFW